MQLLRVLGYEVKYFRKEKRNAFEPRLVAESVEPEGSPPELSPVRSYGQGFQLR